MSYAALLVICSQPELIAGLKHQKQVGQRIVNNHLIALLKSTRNSQSVNPMKSPSWRSKLNLKRQAANCVSI